MTKRPTLHVVGNHESIVVRSYDELKHDLEQATEIIVRQRRLIEALKLELKSHEEGSS